MSQNTAQTGGQAGRILGYFPKKMEQIPASKKRMEQKCAIRQNFVQIPLKRGYAAKQPSGLVAVIGNNASARRTAVKYHAALAAGQQHVIALS